jgi:hypothetical protein
LVSSIFEQDIQLQNIDKMSQYENKTLQNDKKYKMKIGFDTWQQYDFVQFRISVVVNESVLMLLFITVTQYKRFFNTSSLL